MTEPTPKPDEKKPPVTLSDDALKVLQELKDKLQKPPDEKELPPATPAPSYAEERAVLQKKLGFTDEQMGAHEEMMIKSQAPIIERSGWQAIEGKTDFNDLKKEIDAEVKFYPAERRTPEMMEKIYYMVRGRHLDSKPAAPAKLDAAAPPTRISRGPGYNGAEPNLGAGGGDQDKESQLDDVEVYVARKLGVDEKRYAAAKKAGRDAWKLKPTDEFQPTSRADMELRRMSTR